MKDLNEIFPHGLVGIIFDCDGVMIDSLAANRHMYNLILSRLDLPPITEEQERFAFQATAIQALRHMLPARYHGKEAQYIKDLVDYDKEVLPKIRLMPGFMEFIHKAHSFGLRMAIDTNRTDFGIERILDFFSLPPYFEPVITSSNMEPKPSPAGAISICRAWGANPVQALFVGDSEDDKLAAKGSGAAFAAFGGKKDFYGDIEAATFTAFGHILWPYMEKNPDRAPGK